MSSISADQIRHEIQVILKDADLNTLSSKKVRQILETKFNCDFTERKKEIDDILMAEITTRDIQPIQTYVQANDKNNQQMSNEESQAKKLKTQTDDNNQPNSQSDEQTPMEIPPQENQSNIRLSISSTTSTPPKKPTTTTTPASAAALKIERRRTCYNKELDISDQLAVVVGGYRMPRSEVVKRMWVYFKEHNLLDPINKQWINCDDTLAKLFGRRRVRAFGMLKDLRRHMSDPDKQE